MAEDTLHTVVAEGTHHIAEAEDHLPIHLIAPIVDHTLVPTLLHQEEEEGTEVENPVYLQEDLQDVATVQEEVQEDLQEEAWTELAVHLEDHHQAREIEVHQEDPLHREMQVHQDHAEVSPQEITETMTGLQGTHQELVTTTTTMVHPTNWNHNH